ncbi:hypothetical protein ABFA07_018400 [Porites harrisoni]
MADEVVEHATSRFPFCAGIFNRKFLVILALGQLLSWFVCGTGVFSQLLVTNYSIEIPTTQSFLNYLLLGLIYTTALACNPNDFKGKLKERGLKYFFLALFDVEANYLVVKAYQYTNLTSIQVLDCFTTASVLVLSWIFLKVRYQCVHYSGVVICLVGIICLVIADYYGSRYYGAGGTVCKNQVVGDILVLCGSIMYGVSNVAQEFVVKNFSRAEFLGMIGFFGSFISAIQMIILERNQLLAIEWNYKIALYIVGFAICLFLLYNLMPIAMQFSSATVVNLSLLTADFYSLLCGIFLFHYKFSALYLGSLTFIIIGLIVYNLKPTPRRADPPVTQTSLSYRRLEEDSEESNGPVPSLCCQELRNVSE